MHHGVVGIYLISPPSPGLIAYPPLLPLLVYLMSNKDYYGQPQQPQQQQYYPPAGTVFYTGRYHHKVIDGMPARSTTRSGRVLPSAATAGISGLRWSAWLSTTASASTGLRVGLSAPSTCWY
jgi:hypothetical protein